MVGAFEHDGPGPANVELADEYGVIIVSTMNRVALWWRIGAFTYSDRNMAMRGTLFLREGITKFWEDGLKRTQLEWITIDAWRWY